MPKDYYNRHCF